MTDFELTPTTPGTAYLTAESRPGGVDLAVGRSYRWLTAEQAAELGAWLVAAGGAE